MARATERRMDSQRYAELRRMLEDRVQEMRANLRERISELRNSGQSRANSGVRSLDDNPGEGVDDDVNFILNQMRSDTIQRLEQALSRLEEGAYGFCCDCSDEIAPNRLGALPFAIRCKDCEAAHEKGESSSRRGVPVKPILDQLI